jgi:adenosylcobinamide-phosphate synthase
MFLGDPFWLDAAALALALILDITLGEPPAVVHPVVWIGKVVAWLEHRAPKVGRIAQFSYGLGMALAIPAAFAVAGYFLAAATRELNPIAYILITGFLLKSCFAVRGLGQAASAVREKLEADETELARADLSALVSRDTSHLTPSSAASAAVESVAENTTDSFVAPWLAFALFGLPGALAYRAVNTLDAMIGYHGNYEYLGKASARLDDVLNFVPARLSAIIIVAASPLRAHSASRALAVMSKDGSTTESPNAGLTMAAMAGALGVELEKAGHYRLGSGLRQPTAADIVESVRVMQWAAVVVCCLTFVLLMVRHAVW